MIYACKRLVLAGCALVMVVGCAPKQGGGKRGGEVVATRPAVAVLAQPGLREVLDYLLSREITGVRGSTVFTLSHWLMYGGKDLDDSPERPRFEGAPFEQEGAKFFLTVGPMGVLHKGYVPPARDLVMPGAYGGKKDTSNVTIILAGQNWSLGFAMKHGSPELERKLTQLLLEWAAEYRVRMAR